MDMFAKLTREEQRKWKRERFPRLLIGLWLFYHGDKETGWIMVEHSNYRITDKWVDAHFPDFDEYGYPYW